MDNASNVTAFDSTVITQVPNSAVHEEELKRVHYAMTSRIAAAAIADPKFPSLDLLPRIDPLPCNNLGHSTLIDYHRLCEILWGCAAEIKTACDGTPEPRLKRAGIATLILLFVGSAVLYFSGSSIISIIAGIACAFLYRPKSELGRQVAAIKARYIETLLDAGTPLSAHCPAFQTLTEGGLVQIAIGSGILHPNRVPIFLARGISSDPLPGLGWVQARNIYVCPPSSATSTSTEKSSTEKINKAAPRDMASLTKALQSTVQQVASGLCRGVSRCIIHTGNLVIVDSDEIRANSKWLDDKGQPRLFVSDSRTSSYSELVTLEDMRHENGDPDASGRVYFAVQVYLPEHLTLVTVALRFLQASTSASFEEIVVTLGPPIGSKQILRERIRTHMRLRDDVPSSFAAVKRFFKTRPPIKWTIAEALAKWRDAIKRQEDPLESVPEKTELADLFDRKERQESERSEREELAKISGNRWIGHTTRISNWRERHSHPMPVGVFESSEFRAALSTIHSEVITAVLSGVARMGYNVDAYRDARGNITVVERQFVGGQYNENIGTQTNVKQGDHGTVNANQAPVP